jgi:TonB family C-terminal domain
MLSDRIQETPCDECRTPMNSHDDTVTKTCGWMLSLLLHGVSVGTAIVLAVDFSLIPREKRFLWNVSLIATPNPEAIVSNLPSAAAVADESRHMTPSAGSPRSQFPKGISLHASVATSPTGAMPSNSDVDPLPLPNRPDRDATHEHNRQFEGEIAADSASLISPTPQTLSQLTSSRTALTFPVSAPASAEIPAADMETLQRSVMASEPSIQKVSRVVHCPPIQYRDPIVSRAVQADYGWLADMLFTEVERIKRYPSIAKGNHWQGSVVLQAVIRADGGISDIVVAQTSGHAALDQDAVALLEQASPVMLKHQLGQSQVIVQIPIGYRLE